MASLSEVNFEMFGFLCALIASVTTAVQAIVSQKLLKSKEEKIDSMNLVYYMCPLSFLFLTPVAYLKGELASIPQKWEYYGSPEGVIILCLSGLIAFGLSKHIHIVHTLLIF